MFLQYFDNFSGDIIIPRIITVGVIHVPVIEVLLESVIEMDSNVVIVLSVDSIKNCVVLFYPIIAMLLVVRDGVDKKNMSLHSSLDHFPYPSLVFFLWFDPVGLYRKMSVCFLIHFIKAANWLTTKKNILTD
ncbi:MAG: hypothetical protein ACI8PB_004164 [Desulforhopalus sp.]|jgi:hypothetical protein